MDVADAEWKIFLLQAERVLAFNVVQDFVDQFAADSSQGAVDIHKLALEPFCLFAIEITAGRFVFDELDRAANSLLLCVRLQGLLRFVFGPHVVRKFEASQLVEQTD